MKWDTWLNIDLLNTESKLMLKCCVKKSTKKIPESAIATFLPIEEATNVIKIQFALQN